MKLSVVIVNWNVKELLAKCLESIFQTSGGLGLEVIVVDNASSDDSAGMLKRDFKNVILIENKQNIGFGAANNLGIKICKGEYILILNPDTEIIGEGLRKMVDFMDRNPNAGAVGPRILNSDGSIQMTCARNFPTLSTEFFWLTTLIRRFPKNKVIGRYLMSFWDHEEKREVDCLSGASMMIRKSAAENLKYFDEDYFMYGDDVDLCYRIKKAGWKIWYLPEAEIIHYGGGSSKGIAETAAIYDRIAIATFFKKHHGILTVIAYRIMCIFIGLSMSIISGTKILFTRNRGKMRKIFFENLAIFEWAIGLRNK